MTQQVINVGSSPNDGTGDPDRTAFTKCNSNFTELYTSLTSANNAKSYGAVGNGSTNDTAALNLWLASGAVLFLPAGNYAHTPITIPTTVRLIFGPGVFKYIGASGQYCVSTSGATQGLIVQGVGFDCDIGAGIINNSNVGILGSSDNVLFDGVTFFKTNYFGFDVENSTNVGIVNSKFVLTANAVVDAIFFHNCTNVFARGNSVVCAFHNTNGPALYAEGSTGVDFSNNYVDRSQGFGIQSWNSNDVVINANRILNSNIESIRVDAGVTGGSPGATSTGFVVSNNVCDQPNTASNDYGIGVGGFQTGVIQKGLVTGNYVGFAGHSGIAVTSLNTSTVKWVTVAGNTVIKPNQLNAANHAGCLLSSGVGSTIDRVTVQGNTFATDDAFMYYGENESAGGTISNSVVVGNVTRHFTTAAINSTGTAANNTGVAA